MRQALQEELENDPECTFHPQLSEMSELIMRKHAKLSFLERMDIWARKKEQSMKELRDHQKDERELRYSFTPKIVPYFPNRLRTEKCLRTRTRG